MCSRISFNFRFKILEAGVTELYGIFIKVFVKFVARWKIFLEVCKIIYKFSYSSVCCRVG